MAFDVEAGFQVEIASVLESAHTLTVIVLTIHSGSTRDAEMKGRESMKNAANMMVFKIQCQMNVVYLNE